MIQYNRPICVRGAWNEGDLLEELEVTKSKARLREQTEEQKILGN